MNKFHVVFKTHLDVGFTDYASNVVNKYFDSFIPLSVNLAKETRQAGGGRFVWTTGAWLIYEYLEKANRQSRLALEEAILAGDVAWHAMPFTAHTEAFDPSLLRYGLSLSTKLDKRFGKKTISGKMTDVPGHTISMVPYLAEAGIEFIHIGVNPASTAPNVPQTFVWRASDGSEVIVSYSSEDYGSAITIPGVDDVLSFAFTGDNLGPQDKKAVGQEFKKLQEDNSGFEVIGSTMDAFACQVLKVKNSLPVITSEIGDTWIHGVGTDPIKVSQYRALCRLRAKWEQQGKVVNEEFSNNLLLIPEHTWGMDEKMHLGDYVNYSRKDFFEARKKDLIDADMLPAEFKAFGCFKMTEGDESSDKDAGVRQCKYSTFEASWKEQRKYVTNAVAALVNPELAAEAEAELVELKPVHQIQKSGVEVEIGEKCSTSDFSFSFSEYGSIDSLVDVHTSKVICSSKNQIGLYSYQIFSDDDYQRYYKTYIPKMKHDWISSWAYPDFGKPGMDVDEDVKISRGIVDRIVKDKNCDRYVVYMHSNDKAFLEFGAPEQIEIVYTFESDCINVELNWFNKPACRIAEALWFSFNPIVVEPQKWMMDKLGLPVSPLDVVEDGNKNLHAINKGLNYNGNDMAVDINSLDALLVAPGGGRMLQFDNSAPNLSNGFSFNLFNNIWGTNFPMWFEDDAKFRFEFCVES
jgi:hypothetical protein